MKGRRVGRWAVAVFGLAIAVPGKADAQVNVRLHVDWEWSSHDDRSYRDYGVHVERYPRYRETRYQEFYYVPVNGVRVPRGHRPQRGFCRLWYPGVAPGHQPRAVPCNRIRGRFQPGVLIVTWRGVLRPAWDRYSDRYWQGYRQVDYRYRDRDGYRWYDRYDDWWDDRDDDWDDRWDDRDDDRDDRWDRRPGRGNGNRARPGNRGRGQGRGNRGG